ncbi:MAG: RNA polymerase sigma factor [Planctomycetota bacterium]
MDAINAGFAKGAGHVISERSSESGIVDIFLAEFGRLKRIVAGMGLNASDAEDVLQDVSIKALKKGGKCQTTNEAVRWLIKVTVNRCLTEHRHRRRFRRKASEILKRRPEAKTRSKAADDKVIVAEELDIVRETLRQLDKSLLMPMVLRYFCGRNSNEVAEILNLTPSAVRSRLRQGRVILAKRLIEQGIEP